MSDMNRLDDLFRESFRDYQPDVPPQIWEKIAQQQEKRRRPIAWISRSGALLLVLLTASIGIATWWAVGSGERGTGNGEQGMMNRERGTGNDEQGTGNGEQGIVNKEQGTGNDEEGIGNREQGTKNEEQGTANGERGTRNGEQGIMNREQGTEENGNPARITAKAEQGSGSEAGTSGNSRPATKIRKKGSLKSTLTGGGEAEATARTGRVEKTGEEEDDIMNEATKTGENTTQLNPRPVPFVPLDIITAQREMNRELKPIRIPDCPPRDDERRDISDYWELYAGPDYAQKSYSGNSDPALIEKRRETQSFKMAYSAGIRYTRVFANGISLRAGLNYTQINEKFAYLQDNVVQQVFIISPAGDTTDAYYVRGTRYKNSVNRYRSIDLPVVMGYELGKGRFRANVNAGIILNLRSWQSGSTIGNNLQPVNINSSNSAYQYRTQAGLAFTGAVSLYYRLTERMHLLAEPYYRHNLSPLSKASGPVQEQFSIMGLRLGLRMDIP